MIDMTCTTNSASGAEPPATLTVAKLLEIQRSVRMVPDIPEIRESPFAVQRRQARVYARHRAKSAAHHRRMNKKWLKRYGEIETPAAFVMDTDLLGGRRKIMFVHPVLMDKVRSHFKESIDRQFNDVLGGIVCSASGKT